MHQSNVIRHDLLTAGLKTCGYHVTVMMCCIVDSELRWNFREDFDDFAYNKFEDPVFYALNVLRLISLICCINAVINCYIWHKTNIVGLKQWNKIPHSIDFPLNMRIKFIIEALISMIHIPILADYELRTFQ